jgi:hypothetical protein
MRHSADTPGMPDVRSRRAFYRFEIVCQDQPLEMKLESIPDFSYSEMYAVRGPFFGTRSGHLSSLVFLSTSLVAAFRAFNSDSRYGVCFGASRQASEIVAPEAPHSRATFLHIRRDSSCEGERYMKDTVHPIRHPSVHPRIFGRARNKRSCAGSRRSLWARTKHRIGLERPHFCARFRAQSNSWGRSSPTAR